MQFATHLQVYILSLHGYSLHNSLLTEYHAILDNATNTYRGGRKLQSAWWVTVGHNNFQGVMAQSEAPLHSECHRI